MCHETGVSLLSKICRNFEQVIAPNPLLTAYVCITSFPTVDNRGWDSDESPRIRVFV